MISRPYPYGCFAYQLGSCRSRSRRRCFLALPWLVGARIVTGSHYWNNLARLEIGFPVKQPYCPSIGNKWKRLGNRTRTRWHESALFWLGQKREKVPARHLASSFLGRGIRIIWGQVRRLAAGRNCTIYDVCARDQCPLMNGSILSN